MKLVAKFYGLGFLVLALSSNASAGESSTGVPSPGAQALEKFKNDSNVKEAIDALLMDGYVQVEETPDSKTFSGRCYKPAADATYTVCNANYIIRLTFKKANDENDSQVVAAWITADPLRKPYYIVQLLAGGNLK
ncbi:MAG: hypothetical protein JWQ35_2487 [Bacteriovoracaceae bacterium]|nr:hypothetical protein [Bacteriovoracaceae bacterium]